MNDECYFCEREIHGNVQNIELGAVQTDSQLTIHFAKVCNPCIELSKCPTLMDIEPNHELYRLLLLKDAHTSVSQLIKKEYERQH